MNTLSKVLTPIKRVVKRVVLNTSTCSEGRFTKEAKKFPYKSELLVNSYDSNFENKTEPPVFLTYCKECMIEGLHQKAEYSFKNILVINNPYKISPLSALMVFNTIGNPCKVEYTIKGYNGSGDYTKCDETITTLHRVPVLGLYEGRFNPVNVRLLDRNNNVIASKNIKIKTPVLNNPVHNCVKITKSRIPQYYGVYLFKDGKFLFPEKNMRIPAYGNAHTVITHEMDMLGRVYRTYHQKKGMHHWAIEKEPGGNILGLSSSMYDT